MDGVQLPQGYSHFEEAVYFLPLKRFLDLCLYYFYSIKAVSWITADDMHVKDKKSRLYMHEK